MPTRSSIWRRSRSAGHSPSRRPVDQRHAFAGSRLTAGQGARHARPPRAGRTAVNPSLTTAAVCPLGLPRRLIISAVSAARAGRSSRSPRPVSRAVAPKVRQGLVRGGPQQLSAWGGPQEIFVSVPRLGPAAKNSAMRVLGDFGIAWRPRPRQLLAMPKSPSEPPGRPPRIDRIIRGRGRRGPRPKSAAQHKITGTYQPVRHAGREVKVEAPGDLASKPPPEWLTTQQKKFWGEALADAPKGLLRRADWAMFVGYVETWDRYTRLVQAQQRLDADLDLPFLVRGSGGPALSPYLRAMNHCCRCC